MRKDVDVNVVNWKMHKADLSSTRIIGSSYEIV